MEMTGKAIRLRKIFSHASGKCIIVPYSHAVLSGPQKGLENTSVLRNTLAALRPADGIVLPMGSVRHVSDLVGGRDQPVLLLHADWHPNARTVLPSPRPAGATNIVTPEAASAAGADGLMAYMYLGLNDPSEEHAEVSRIAALALECERAGLVLIVESRSAQEHTKDSIAYDPKTIAMHARVAAELGADIVKCVYSGSVESFRSAVEACPVPVVAAGGPKKDTPDGAVGMARSVIQAGAAGIMFGRNVWQSSNPGELIKSLSGVVHDEMRV